MARLLSFLRGVRVTSVGIRAVRLGSGVKLVKPVNLYGGTISSDAFVGPFVEIQPGVHVGERTRIQSHTFICSNVSIGDDCFIGHGVVFTNDLLKTGPARGDKTKYKKTTLGNRVSVGSNSTILPVRIEDDIIIGAGSVVTKDLLTRGVYAGNPARLLREI